MRTVKCKSGKAGWQCRLQKNYADIEDFKNWAEIYGLHLRLGYKTPESAWKKNPIVQGSTDPADYRKIPKKQ